MTKDLLDDLDIDAILKQAGREGVAQGVVVSYNRDNTGNP